MRIRRIILLSASALVLLLVVLAVALYFTADRIANSDRVRAMILPALSEAISGTAGYDRLDVRFFPLPHFVIHGLKLTYPGGGARVEETALYPSLPALLRGAFLVGSVSLKNPGLEFTLPEKKETPFDPAEIEKKMIPIFRGILEYAPGLDLDVSGGTVRLSRGEGPWLFRNVDLNLALSSNLDVALKSGSSPWGALSFKGRFSHREGVLELTRASGSVGGSSVLDASARLDWSQVLRLKADVGKTVLQLQELDLLTERRIARVLPTLKTISGTVTLASGSFEGPLRAPGEWRYTAAGSLKNLLIREERIPEPLRIAAADFSTNQEGVSLRNAEARAFDSDLKMDLRLVFRDLGIESPLLSGTVGRKTIRFLSTRTGILSGMELPSDIAVKGGFSYHPGIVELKNLNLSTGRSSVSNLSGRLQLTGGDQLSIGADRVVLVPGEFGEQGLRNLRRAVPDLKSLSGIFTFTAVRFEGDPGRMESWQYKISGEVQNAVVEMASLPGPVRVPAAAFSADQGQISFRDARAVFLDSDLAGAGRLRFEKGKAGGAEIQFAGGIGEESIRWASRQFEWPEKAVLPRSLAVQGGRLSWAASGLFSLEGGFDIRPADGPNPVRLSFELDRSPGSFRIRNASLRDNSTDASFSLDYGRDRVAAFTFSGSLRKSTLDALYRIDQPEDAWISGRLSGRIPLEQPRRLQATGALKAGNLILPLGEYGPLLVKGLDFNSERDLFQIRSSDLVWQDHAFSVQGSARTWSGRTSSASVPKRIRVDADVRTERIDVDALTKIFEAPKTEAEAKPAEKQAAPPFGWVAGLPIDGTVRIKADRVIRRKLAIEPLAAEISIGTERIRVFVERALLCSVPMPGTVEIKPGRLLFTARSEMKNMPIAPILRCLTGERMGLTGAATFRTELEGTDRISESLWGDGELVIRRGRIYRLGILKQILDFLNITQIVMGGLPDFGGKGMPYDVIRIRYRLDGNRLILSRIILRGDTLGIAGDGSIDLARNTMNLTLLVSPLRTVDKILSRIPIVRNFRGILGVPVSVYGKVDSPVIVPLSPGAVGSHIFDLMKEVIQLPFSLF